MKIETLMTSKKTAVKVSKMKTEVNMMKIKKIVKADFEYIPHQITQCPTWSVSDLAETIPKKYLDMFY